MNKQLGSAISISRNLSVSLVLVLVGVIAATVFTHCLVISHNEKKELGEKADELLSNLQKSVELPIWNFDREALEKIAGAYFLSDPVAELLITEGVSREIIIRKIEPGDLNTIVREGNVLHQGEVIAHIKLGLTKKYYQRRLERLISSYAVTGVILIVIVVFVTGFLLRIFLKNPFDNLIQGLDKIAAGDYSYKLTQVRQKEFSHIVDRFENMADTLQTRERSLNSAKNYISDLFNSIDSILVGVDAEGRVTHWNKRAQDMAEKSFDDALGKHFSEMLPWLGNKGDMIGRALSGGTLEKDPKFQVNSESGVSYVSIAVAPLTSEAQQGAVVRIDDVSDRVRLEEMMIQTEKMLSVGGLAAGMAHEINNPLAGMLQNSQVIENRLSVETMPANIKAAQEWGITMPAIKGYMTSRGVFELLSSVRQAGSRAARIVENMLSFSRKSNSGFVASDLRAVVDDTLELAANDYDLKKKYDFKSIIIEKEYSSDMVNIPCDLTKIQQVILNILKNGAQAMGENRDEGKKPCFVLRIRKARGTGIIEIEDNGPGMDESIRKRVFEPFFTTKPVGVGTGLGLSVSYFIITENHGGSLAVESSPGKGARFIIRLPLGRTAQLDSNTL
ncbi:MAG: PAS domain-containing protein [Desulfobacteraceae bacterium]|nr:PAS domain-containing protein [Desulfobacteraceae bacterium]